MKRSWISLGFLTSLMLVLGCPADDPAGQDGDGTAADGSGTAMMSDSAPMMTTTTTTTDPPPSDSSDGDPSAESTSEDDGTSSGSDGPDEPIIPENPTPCGNQTYECGDTLDNDGDGLYDLFDPECTGPCDDDEAGFQTGIPGDNVDCIQDCFFDGNSGQGDDGCNWNLTCDPANPGADVNNGQCAYTGGNNCNNQPPNQSPDCIEFCSQFTPPGCDCFGCCTVLLPDGTTVDIFLNSGPDCALDNLDACNGCTSQAEECGNPCIPETCELCFGQTQLPDECGEQTCDNELPCMVNEDCPTGYYCLGGCCYPPPPG